MKRDWLWDRKTSISRAKAVLKNPADREFFILAPLLLARKNNPKEVFREYLDPRIFCRNWPAIKKRMRQDKWIEPRIVFWQAVYENLADKYRKRGIVFRKGQAATKDVLYEEVGRKISVARRRQGLSQKKLAKRLGVSQQLISRIERGNENTSLATLRKVSGALNKRIEIEFV